MRVSSLSSLFAIFVVVLRSDSSRRPLCVEASNYVNAVFVSEFSDVLPSSSAMRNARPWESDNICSL